MPIHLVESTFETRHAAPSDFAVAGVTLPPDLVAAVPERRAAHLAGRLCAREALRAAGAGDRTVERAASGAPVWPDGILGSISHVGTVAGAAVTPAASCRGLGLDYEQVMSPAAAGEISELVLRDGDGVLLGAYPELSFEEGVTLVFSLKESVYKAMSPRLTGFAGFEDAEMVSFAGGRARLRLLRSLADDLPAGTELEAVYALSVGFVRTLAILL